MGFVIRGEFIPKNNLYYVISKTLIINLSLGSPLLIISYSPHLSVFIAHTARHSAII